LKVITSPEFAVEIACGSEPSPEAFAFCTTMLAACVVGSTRKNAATKPRTHPNRVVRRESLIADPSTDRQRQREVAVPKRFFIYDKKEPLRVSSYGWLKHWYQS
jgi:hypothetical protein